MRVGGGCGKESPSHGFAVPAPFRQGGRGDGGCGLPRPVTWFFARGVVVDVRRDTWVPPYIALFCRAGPVCPAVGAGKTRSGRCGHRPLRKCILRCVGEGLCPSHGRGRTPPLRRVTRGATGGRTEASAPTDGYKRYSGRVVQEADPYGWLQGIQRAGRCGHRPLRRVTRGAGVYAG